MAVQRNSDLFPVHRVSLTLVLVFGLLTLIGCGGGSDDATDEGDTGGNNRAKWTYMVYMAGDNNLSDAVIEDIREMEQVGSTSDVNIVVQMELSPRFTTGLDATLYNTHRGRVSRGDSDLVSLGNLDMGARKTLKDFIAWSAATYPADRYALVLWSHGAGWRDGKQTGGVIRGALQDESSDSFMSLPNIAAAVRESGVHPDVINFDACLMAMYEVTYEFIGLTDYMAFSEEVVPGNGDPYDTILTDLTRNPSMSARNLASTIVNLYQQYYRNAARSDVTKSAVDMSHALALHNALNNLAVLLTDSLSESRPSVQIARDEALNFEYRENRDLGDFLSRLEATVGDREIVAAASSARAVMNDMMLINTAYSPNAGAAIENATGLSIYLPRRDQVTNSDLNTYAGLAINQSRAEGVVSWGSLVNLLITGDTASGLSSPEKSAGNFVIWLEWDTDADLDLLVWEPDGYFAAPYIGTASPNGFLSGDSCHTNISAEYYAAAEVVDSGDYDVIVQYYEDGPLTTGQTTASLYILDPLYGLMEFTLQAQRLMDLSRPAPENWYESEDEWVNVYVDMYSDWWISCTLTRSDSGRAFRNSGLPQGISDRIRVSFQPVPSKGRQKASLPQRMENKTVIPR